MYCDSFNSLYRGPREPGPQKITGRRPKLEYLGLGPIITLDLVIMISDQKSHDWRSAEIPRTRHHTSLRNIEMLIKAT